MVHLYKNETKYFAVGHVQLTLKEAREGESRGTVIINCLLLMKVTCEFLAVSCLFLADCIISCLWFSHQCFTEDVIAIIFRVHWIPDGRRSFICLEPSREKERKSQADVFFRIVKPPENENTKH